MVGRDGRGGDRQQVSDWWGGGRELGRQFGQKGGEKEVKGTAKRTKWSGLIEANL